MGSGEVIGESDISRVSSQSSLEPVRRCAPFRGETSDRNPVAGNHDRLTVLNRVEELARLRAAWVAVTVITTTYCQTVSGKVIEHARHGLTTGVLVPDHEMS